MKKLLAFIILISFMLFLSSCVKFSKIEDNFVEAGYTYSEESSFIAESLLSEFENAGITVSIYAFNKPSKVAIVIEFEDKDDISIALNNSNTLKLLTVNFDIDDLSKKNFLVIPIAISEEDQQEIIDIFQD